jgi:hypothetical protein
VDLAGNGRGRATIKTIKQFQVARASSLDVRFTPKSGHHSLGDHLTTYTGVTIAMVIIVGLLWIYLVALRP